MPDSHPTRFATEPLAGAAFVRCLNEGLVLLLLFAAPLVYAWSTSEFYLLPRLIFIRGMAWFAFGMHGIAALLEGESIFQPRRLGGVIAAILLLIFFSASQAPSPRAAFFEACGLVPFFLLFFNLWALGRRSTGFTMRAGFVMASACGIAAGVGLVESVGFDPLGRGRFVQDGAWLFHPTLVFSTFGNRNALGAFLVCSLFPLVGYFLALLDQNRRVAAAPPAIASCLLVLPCLIAIRSRGVHLALVAGGLFFFALVAIHFFRARIRDHRLTLAGALFALFGLAAMVPLMGGIAPYRDQSLLDKWFSTLDASTYDTSRTNTLERLTVLHCCFQDWRSQPLGRRLFGAGIGSFKSRVAGILGDRLPEEVKNQLVTVVFRQLHNDWAQILLEFGLVGLLALLLLLASLVYRGFYFFLETAQAADRLLAAGFLTGVFACTLCAHYDFVLHQGAVPLYLVCFFALLIAPASRGEDPPPDLGGHRWFLCFALALAILPWLVREVRILAADRLGVRATPREPLAPLGKQVPVNPIRDLRDALALDALPGERWFHLGLALLNETRIPEKTRLVAARQALDESLLNINFSGRTPEFLVHVHRADIARRLGSSELERASLERGLRIAFGEVRQRFLVELGLFTLRRDEMAGAEDFARKAREARGDSPALALLEMSILGRKKDWNGVLVAGQKILQSETRSALLLQKNPDFNRDVGRAHLELGRFQEGLAWLGKARELPGIDPGRLAEIEEEIRAALARREKEILPGKGSGID